MSRIPELTEHQRDVMALGLCPFCEAQVRDYRPPAAGGFAPEAFQTIREQGRNPLTGHRKDCDYQDVQP